LPKPSGRGDIVAEVEMQGQEPPFNPYEPPKADLEGAPEVVPVDAALASRWRRLGAALLDTFIAAVAALPMTFGRTMVSTR
jgi:hypothetical protein